MNEPLAMDQDLIIRLTLAEAIVLSNSLNRLNGEELLAPFVDKAKQIAFWALDCVLERENPIIFSSEYDEYLQEAKTHLTRGTDE